MAVKRAPSKKVRAEAGRRPKKNPLNAAKVTTVDYKDINLLRQFISDRGKIRSRRVTGLTPQQQRQVADGKNGGFKKLLERACVTLQS